MKIIFLDDSDVRWSKFLSKVPAAYRAETATQCIDMIKDSPDIQWLFLDHDLGGETWVDSSREDCGMEVVRFLCVNDYTAKIKSIVVHSHNVSAAKEMHLKLEEKGYKASLLPFNYLIEHLNYDNNTSDKSAA